jgi:hypothetical protein
MSCLNCECDACIEAHPMTDEQVEIEEAIFQHDRLMQMFYVSGMNVPSSKLLFDAHYMVGATRHAANDLRRLAEGVLAGIDRVWMLVEEQKDER